MTTHAGQLQTEVEAALGTVTLLTLSTTPVDRFPQGGDLDEVFGYAVGVPDSVPSQADRKQARTMPDGRQWMAMDSGLLVKFATRIVPDRANGAAGSLALHQAKEPEVLGALMNIRDTGGAPALTVRRITRQTELGGEVFVSSIVLSVHHPYPVTRP